jgi:ribosomal protein S6
MAKYEIMLVVDGSIDKDKAKESIAELEKLIDRTKNFECQELGHKTLAYKINNKDKG